ncbi:efflux RND transporter periplasmic adaptor subunit [bacterium]|nr:efflux RND transporter periplasmic adaptor subunit [bacterium]
MRILFVAITLALLVGLLAACTKNQGGQGGGGFQMPPTATIVAPVQLIDYAPAIELVGEVRATQRATLSAEVGGRVTRIAHRVGEAHHLADGALVQINPTDYQTQLAQAEAGLAQAKEGLKMAENGARPQEVAAQRAQVEAAQAQYEQALDNLKRQQELFNQGVVSETVLIAAQTQADSAKAALDAQRERLDQVLEGVREEELASARAAVQLAQSQVDYAANNLAKTAIRPAFNATVTALFVEEGSFVGPGSPVAEVVALEPGEAWFNLPETDVQAVQAGDVVELRFDALPDVLIDGTVLSVSAAADETTRQFPVRVAINDARPLPGMVAYGRLLTTEPVPTPMIPRDATVLTNLGTVVYVMQPPDPNAEPPMEGMPPLPTVNMVLVELGAAYGDLVVVSADALQPGMMVVSRGNENLYQGASIIPTNLMGGENAGGPPAGAGAPTGAPSGEAVPAGAEGQGAPPEQAMPEDSGAVEGGGE